jgi:hypothetical protein
MNSKGPITKFVGSIIDFIRNRDSQIPDPSLPITNKIDKDYEVLELPPSEYDVRLIKAKDTKAFGTLLCDAYELSGHFTINDIANFVCEKQKHHPNHRLFATLDDFDQACYTFGHTCHSQLHEDEMEGYGETESLNDFLPFEKRAENFKRLLPETSLDQIFSKRFWADENEQTPSLKTQDWKEQERFAYVQIVPVNCAADGLISFPNGYFSGDYSPFENYRLAETLEKQFQFEVFGIGASYIGFMRTEPIIDDELDRLVSWLYRLFSQDDHEHITTYLRNELDGKSIFYLCYAER